MVQRPLTGEGVDQARRGKRIPGGSRARNRRTSGHRRGRHAGVPDAQWGEAIKAVCTRKPGQTATAQQIIDFVGGRIARYKRPKYGNSSTRCRKRRRARSIVPKSKKRPSAFDTQWVEENRGETRGSFFFFWWLPPARRTRRISPTSCPCVPATSATANSARTLRYYSRCGNTAPRCLGSRRLGAA